LNEAASYFPTAFARSELAVPQFDIVENDNPITRAIYPFLVVLQHDRISPATTVIVAPLTQSDPRLASSRLHPAIPVGGHPYSLLTEELAAVRRNSLGRTVSSAEPQRYAIIAALDLCFTGI
jgi:hypothetical protein